jgi:hypothetical protein
MSNWKALVAVSISVITLTFGAVKAQQTSVGASQSLTTQDYLEIQMLGARYAYGLDTGENNGYMYADVFTPDGVFGSYVGRERLAEVARGGRLKARGYQHFVTNTIIEPSPEGAKGSQYVQVLHVGGNGKPVTIDHGGRYEDVYVRTPLGWRIKARKYVRIFPPDAAESSPAR